jgi:hypothetical protein
MHSSLPLSAKGILTRGCVFKLFGVVRFRHHCQVKLFSLVLCTQVLLTGAGDAYLMTTTTNEMRNKLKVSTLQGVCSSSSRLARHWRLTCNFFLKIDAATTRTRSAGARRVLQLRLAQYWSVFMAVLAAFSHLFYQSPITTDCETRHIPCPERT